MKFGKELTRTDNKRDRDRPGTSISVRLWTSSEKKEKQSLANNRNHPVQNEVYRDQSDL